MLVGYFHRSSLLLSHIRQTGMFFLSIFCFSCFVFLRLQQSLALQNDKCIMIDWPMAKAFVAVRSVTDILFSVNILLQVCFLFAYFLL